MISNFLLKKIQSTRDDIRTSAQGVTLTLVTRTVSGTLGDYYGQYTKVVETTTDVKATGGFVSGYTYDETVGGVIEKSGVQFELSRDNLATLRTPSTIVRFSGEDYSIDSVNDLIDTNEISITCSRLKL